MPAISFEVCWSDTASATFNQDTTQQVGNVVDNIMVRAGEQLPEYDANGEMIVYVLFKENKGDREAITRSRTLDQAGIRQGDRLYLANKKAPWWNVTTLKKPVTRNPRDSKRDQKPPERGGSSSPPTTTVCHLQLAAGCVMTVSSTETIDLNRAYLLKKLPGNIVTCEKARIFAGLSSRLNSVSREQHCQIFRQGDYWLLRAFKPTYVYSRTIDKGMTVTLSTSTTIVLGREGWPVEVLIGSI